MIVLKNQEIANKKSNENSIVLMKNQKLFLNQNQFSTNQILLHIDDLIFRKVNVLYVTLVFGTQSQFP